VFPNWIIAGAPKAGTSSLFRWLVDHPEVSGSAEKETYYFVDRGTHMFSPTRNFVQGGLAGYARLFEHCDATSGVILESTPGYLYSETALRELPRLPSSPSFIFVLREPVAQLHSLFSYFQQNWNWISRQMSFGEFIAAANQGREKFKGNELAANALRNAWYPEHLRRWKAAVGRERMFILLFEDLIGGSRPTMRRIAKRIGIDPAFYDDYDFPPENRTYVARSGALQDLNVIVRSRLPQGRLYDALRRLYRAANTKAPTRAADDPELDCELAERYAAMIPELEQEFELDLTSWRQARNATLASPAAARPHAEGDCFRVTPSLVESAAK